MGQVERVKNVLLRDMESQTKELLKHCFHTFRDEVFDDKNKQAMGKSVEQFQKQLETFANASSANAKALLARMNAGSEEALIGMSFKCWFDFHEDYKKNKEIEDAVKQAEKKVQDF